MRKHTYIVSFILVAIISGCVTLNRSYKLGMEEELNKNFEQAINLYQRAALENPKEPVYRLALARARASATLYYLNIARTAVVQGKKQEAVAAYQKAQFFDPLNRMIAEEMRELAQEGQGKPREIEEKISGPVSLKTKLKTLDLSFRTEVSLKSIFQALSRMAEINFLYDETFRDVLLAADLTGKSVEQAIGFLCAASRNFYRLVDEKTVLIAPDNIQKRQQYELNVVKTFYLSNINAQDVQMQLVNVMRSVYRAPNIQVDKNLNALTVRDTPQVVEKLASLLSKLDKPRGEVLVDIEIMEVSRQKLQKLGVDLTQNIISGQYGIGVRLNPLDSRDTGWFRLSDLNLKDKTSYQLSIPNAIVQFLGTDTDTRIIAQPRIRGVSGEEIKYLVGQKVPIIQSYFNPIAAGGVNTQPIVSFTQQDVGIELKLKPRIHFEKEVTLELEIKISSISGKGVQDIPIIATREIKNILRLKDGETNLLAGLLRDEERKSIAGIPGLKELPIVGHLFSTTETVIDKTDVILTITPHIIRPFEISAEDLKPLWLESDSLSGVTSLAEELYPLAREESPGFFEDAVFLSPSSLEVSRGDEFRVELNIASANEIKNLSLTINFNSQVLQLKEIIEGDIIRQIGEKVPFLKSIGPSTGTLGFSSPASSRGYKGTGILAVLVFVASGQGESPVTIGSVSGLSADNKPLKFDYGESQVVVR